MMIKDDDGDGDGDGGDDDGDGDGGDDDEITRSTIARRKISPTPPAWPLPLQ